jgi:hypothetical protein
MQKGAQRRQCDTGAPRVAQPLSTPRPFRDTRAVTLTLGFGLPVSGSCSTDVNVSDVE